MVNKASSKNKKQVAKPVVAMNKNKTFFIAISIICLLSFISFIPSLFNQVDIWDDYYYLAANPLIKDLSWLHLKEIFTAPYLANYQPLSLLSYALEFHFFQLSPLPYHLSNIVIHMVNASLLFWFVDKLTSKFTVAFITALLFAIHPLHVESVTWVSERKDVLYALFFITGMLSYLKFTEVKEKKYYFLALILFVFSCLSKGMAVTFSVVLVLIDYFKDKKFRFSKLVDKIPFFVISLAFGLLAFKVQKEGGAVAFATNEAYSSVQRILFANYSLFFYLFKMIIPLHLSGLYSYPQDAGLALPVAYYISPLVNALFLFWIIYSIKRSKKVVFGSLFFLVCILPVLQVISIGAAIAADRYFYVSSIGLFFLVGTGFSNLFDNKKYRQYRSLLAVAGSVIILGLCYITFERTKVWKNAGVFWGNVAEEFPRLELAHYNRAAYFYSNKDYEAALAEFSKALILYPDYKEALQWRADIYTKKTQYVLAVKDLTRLTQLDSTSFDNYFKLGELYGKYLHDLNKGETYLLKAYKLKHDDARTLSYLGVVYGMKGDYANALLYFKKILDVNPNDTTTLENISVTYKNAGDVKMANEYLLRLAKIKKK